MRAMIMAAGRGLRMRPLTNKTHKGLLLVKGKSLIDYHVERLAAIGVKDIVINVSYFAEKIIAHLGDGSQFGVDIQYSIEDEPLEVGGGIVKALPLFDDKPFIVINCDVWCDFPLAHLLSPIPNLGKLILVSNPSHHPTGDFILESNKMIKLPATGESSQTLTYSGIGVYKPELFMDYPINRSLSLLNILRKAIQSKQISAEHYQGCWKDVGTPQRLAELQD